MENKFNYKNDSKFVLTIKLPMELKNLQLAESNGQFLFYY
jgi:hypothetical protein